MERTFKINSMSGLVIWAILLPIFTFVSCGDSSKASDSNSVSQQPAEVVEAAPDLIILVSPTDRQELPSGTAVRVKIQYAGKTTPDSVQVWFAGQPYLTLGPNQLVATIGQEKTGTTGVRAVKLLAFSGKKRPQTITAFLTFLSDLEPVRYRYTIVNVFPHDDHAYTQGLVFHDGLFFEGTGLEGQSTLRKVELSTGSVVKRHGLESTLFGEGITIFQNKIYQLTWKSKVGFIYDLETFRQEGKFYYNTEGWGLTTMGDKLVMSDGTNKLYIVDPATFAVSKTLEVYDNQSVVVNLNELEFIDGEIWANIYTTDLIARIDPASGKVTGYVDLTGLLSGSERRSDGNDVLNGIAWDEATERIFVTGKNWPKLFQIKVHQ